MLARVPILFIVFVVSLLATLSGCGDSPNTPSARLDLTGTWSGQVGPPASGTALRLTWVATQSGNVASGIATLVKPAVGVPARSTMTGVLEGDRLLLTYGGPPASVQGFPRCEISGAGSATATSTRITGALGLMFMSCAGTGLEAPGSNELSLTR